MVTLGLDAVASMFGSMLFRLTHRLRGSTALERLREIRNIPGLPPERIASLQLDKLRQLLAHAGAHVPYYRDLFAGIGLDARDIRSLDDFARLPVLTKGILREQGDRLLADGVDKSALFRHHSGGSTGRPGSFYRDRNDADLSEAGTYRTQEQCGWRPGEMVAFVWGSNEKIEKMSRLEFEARQILRCSYLFDPFSSSAEDMDGWIRRWRNLRPSVAFGYASTLARFAAHVERRGAKLPPLKGAFTTAEKLYKPQRESIERALGCKAFDCYGSSEVRNIAAECSHGAMHVHSDFVVAETEPGGPGPRPFVLTALNNYAMPFIRYRNEDCGELLGSASACGCGSNFPLMKLDVARVSDNFTLPGGRVVHGEYFTHLMYGSQGIESFQFHQLTPEKMVLWIVPSPGHADRRTETVRKAVDEVERLAPGRINVEVRETDAIELSAQGKHRFTRSDVPAFETAAAPVSAGN